MITESTRAIIGSDYSIQNPTAIRSNGIWNTPYIVNGSVVDHYPLADDPNYKIPIITGTPVIYCDMKRNMTLSWNVAGGLTSIINSYILYKNGTSIQAGRWEYNSQIQLPISNAVFGNYNYTLWISDGITTEQSTTLLHVMDYAPTLSPLTNQTWLMGSGMHTLNWTINDSLVLESTYDIRINGTVVITGNCSAPSDQINLDLNTSLSSWFNTIHFNSTTLNNYM